MKVNFYKMNGAGNEFVIVDNSRNEYSISKSLIEKMSNKTTGPGCDQFISIEKINKSPSCFHFASIILQSYVLTSDLDLLNDLKLLCSNKKLEA